MKKILVIGSQGYLGSQLTDYLQEYGYSCTGVDTGFFKSGLLYPPKHVPMLEKEARTLEETDIDGYDVVLQLAGISNDPFGNLSAERIYDPTRVYALRIATMCKKLGVRFIFPSSCSVYGIGAGLMDEDGPTNPQTHYSINKVQVEHDLAAISDASFSPIALRLATVFGVSPRIRFDVVINMLCGMAITEKRLILNSDGQAWRPHVHIDDVCEAFRCCIEWDYCDGKLMILNVGREDNNQKILDVARTIQSKISACTLSFLNQDQDIAKDDLVRDRKIQDGVDTRTYQVSFERIHKILPGFQARWAMETGVQQLLDALQNYGLDKLKFKQREFYRLQQIEYLYKSGALNDSLQWN